MENWASSGEFDVNFICICVNGDSTAQSVAKDFANRYRMSGVVNGYISDQANLPSFGQLGCQGLMLVDVEGNFIWRRSPAFLKEGEKAWRKVEKKLLEIGCYRGEKGAADFEEAPLRFAVGARVECRCGRDLWIPGKVVATHVFAMGREMPYKIHLDDGRMTVAPIDSDQVIRKLVSDETPEIPSVGVPEMDHEHEVCMDALKRLRAERTQELLEEVHNSLKVHFQEEEDMFAKYGFGNHGTAMSGTKSHCEDHARILTEIQAQFGHAISEEFVLNLIDRVVTHTCDYDTKYAGKIGSSAV